MVAHNYHYQQAGGCHPLIPIINKIYDFFRSMGFHLYLGNEIETYNRNFLALNIQDHDLITFDDATFYLREKIVLRSHLSSLWIKLLQTQSLPFAFLEIGKVYRKDSKGSLYRPMFYQAEGLIIDSHVSLADLKGVMQFFVNYFFNGERQMFFKPYWHAFTCPGAIIEISCDCQTPGICNFCGGSGKVQICTAGMIDENILIGQGVNPDEYRGLAFGLGPTRLAQLVYCAEQTQLMYNNTVGLV